MVKYVPERLYSYLRKEGIKVDNAMKKILGYFSKNVLVTFSASGSDSCPTNYDEKISESLHINEDIIFRRRMQLQRARILGFEKGLSSIGGKEFELGLTKKAKSILEGLI